MLGILPGYGGGGGGGGLRNLIVIIISQAAPPLLPLLLKVAVRFFASDMIHRLHRCGNQGNTNDTIEGACFFASGGRWVKSAYSFNIMVNIISLVAKGG